MIEYTSGDLFDSGCEALVNPVNCVGVMGAGLALQFKLRFPEMFKAYLMDCRRRLLEPGSLQPVDVDKPDSPKWVLNLSTKDDWRDPSKLEWIETGLTQLRKFIISAGIKSVAVPALGCGCGELSWDEVKALIDVKLAGMDAVIKVYPPHQRGK